MKRKLLILLAILVVLVPAALWFFGDEELGEGAKQWQAWHEERAGQPGEGYLYQMGLDGPVGTDPLSAGEQWHRAFRDKFAAATNPLSAATRPPWAEEQLAGPEPAHLDALIGCASDRVRECEGLDEFLEQHALLLQRFKSWPVERGFEVSAPDLLLVPRLEMTVAGSRLAWLEAEQAMSSGEHEHAASLIVGLMDKLRAYQEQTDSLLQMIIAIRLISDLVDRLVILSNNDHLIALELDLDHLLRDFRAPNLILERVMRGEFGYSLNWIIHNPVPLDGKDRFNDRVFRLFHRTNISINTSHDLRRWAAGLDKPSDLSAIGNGSMPALTVPFSLRNFFGSTLLRTSDGFYLTNIARFHDLQTKLALARAWLSDPGTDDDSLQRLVRVNPFGHGHGVELDQPNSRLCMAGPYEDSGGIRCIPVVLP
jgi:hypothetical protein